MKLLVFSDSHGTMESMYRAVKKEHPDYILHLGDLVSDAEYLRWKNPEVPFLLVRGNCDCDCELPEKRCFPVEGVRIFMCHGHTYNVKAGLLRATLAAKEENADVLLYGHTHEPFCEKTEDLLILNPGACGAGRHPTYGLLTVTGGTLKCEIISAEDEK